VMFVLLVDGETRQLSALSTMRGFMRHLPVIFDVHGMRGAVANDSSDVCCAYQ